MELPETWTLIAQRGVDPKWYEVPGAPVSIRDARQMHQDGLLMMSQQRLPFGNMGLLVKAPAKGAQRKAR